MLCQPSSSTQQNKHNCCTPTCTQYTIKFGKGTIWGSMLQFKLFIYLFFGLRGSIIAARLTFMPKRGNFIAPLVALIQENNYLLTYCTVFHFYGTLSSFHHDIEAEEGVPPIVSWEFEQITWETRLT